MVPWMEMVSTAKDIVHRCNRRREGELDKGRNHRREKREQCVGGACRLEAGWGKYKGEMRRTAKLCVEERR